MIMHISSYLDALNVSAILNLKGFKASEAKLEYNTKKFTPSNQFPLTIKGENTQNFQKIPVAFMFSEVTVGFNGKASSNLKDLLRMFGFDINKPTKNESTEDEINITWCKVL